MDVAAISAKDGRVAEKATTDGQGDIDERESKGHEWSGHAEEGPAVLAPNKAEAAEHKAHGEAAAVAEKDGGRAEVVAEKGEQAAAQGNGGHREAHVAVEDGCKERGDDGEEADTGGETVESVDEVEGVAAADQPQ